MTSQQGIYKCDMCGNIVEVLHTGAGVLVCCGSNMQLLAENSTYRAFLKPGDDPKACFSITASKVTARAYCNLHGLWQATS